MIDAWIKQLLVDCWAGERSSDGTIVPDKDRFPE